MDCLFHLSDEAWRAFNDYADRIEFDYFCPCERCEGFRWYLETRQDWYDPDPVIDAEFRETVVSWS